MTRACGIWWIGTAPGDWTEQDIQDMMDDGVVVVVWAEKYDTAVWGTIDGRRYTMDKAR